MAFLVALADLARIFDGRATTGWLSELAEASVTAAIDHLLLSTHESGKLKLKNIAAPSEGSGVIVLGMGKLGASELNYSSDIDLVIFFDEEAGIVPDPDDAIEIFPRMMRRLVRILQERTADGYVFRTDLRLRPDPGSTPLAIPVDAAMIYYEGRGRTGNGPPSSRPVRLPAISRLASSSCAASLPSSSANISIMRRLPTSIPSSGRSMPTRAMAQSP